MTGEGVTVREVAGSLGEGLIDLVRDDGCTDGAVTTGHTLGARDHVGDVAIRVAGKHFTDTTECTNNLVRNHEDVVLVADLAHALHVSGRWCERATGVLNGLKEDSCNSVGAFELNHFFDAVCCPLTECVEVIGVLFSAVEVGVRNAES